MTRLLGRTAADKRRRKIDLLRRRIRAAHPEQKRLEERLCDLTAWLPDRRKRRNGEPGAADVVKPDNGNYTKDGNLITSKVGIYSANSNGLFDMAGNVAEWTSTIYTEAGVEAMNDINPQLSYNAAIEDPYRLKKKSVRGGSWKDPESYIRSAWRSSEYQNQPRSYIGFRCVRSLANTTSEKIRTTKKK